MSACFAIVVMALNGDYSRTRRWAQFAILAASAGGLIASVADRAWLFGVAYLFAGGIAIRRAVRGHRRPPAAVAHWGMSYVLTGILFAVLCIGLFA